MFGDGLRLRIPGVHMRQAALLQDDENVLRSTMPIAGAGIRMEGQQLRQRPAENADGPGTK